MPRRRRRASGTRDAPAARVAPAPRPPTDTRHRPKDRRAPRVAAPVAAPPPPPPRAKPPRKTTITPRKSLTQLFQDPLRRAELQAPACIALLSAAAALAALRIFEEATYHAEAPRAGVALALIALLAGMSVGVVVPRAMIAIRAGAQPSRLVQTSATFAGHAAGVLLLATAGAWLLALFGANSFEAYRGWLVANFVAPQAILSVLLWAPALLIVGLSGALTATTLLALHGWYQLVASGRRGLGRVWIAALGFVAFAAVVAWRLGRPDVALFAAPFLLCAAAVLATLNAARSDVTLPATRVAPRPLEIIPLMSSVLIAFCVGVAWLRVTDDARPASVTIAVAAAGGALGAWSGRRMLSLAAPSSWAPRLALLAAVTLFLPFGQIVPGSRGDLLRLACVAVAVGAAIVFIGRQFALRCGSPQRALAAIGPAAAIGGILAAIVILLPDRPTSFVASIWPASHDDKSASDYVQQLLREGSADQRVAVAPLTAELDLSAPMTSLDGLTILAPAESAISANRAARFVARAERALPPSGRFALQLPASPVVISAVERAAQRRGAGVYRLTLRSDDTQAEFLLFGADVGEWLRHEGDTSRFALALEPWPTTPAAQSH